jgi:hypothetical protein
MKLPAFPEVWMELTNRYNAPGGALNNEVSNYEDLPRYEIELRTK